MESYYVAKAGLKRTILLPQLSGVKTMMPSGNLTSCRASQDHQSPSNLCLALASPSSVPGIALPPTSQPGKGENPLLLGSCLGVLCSSCMHSILARIRLQGILGNAVCSRAAIDGRVNPKYSKEGNCGCRGMLPTEGCEGASCCPAAVFGL